MVITKKLKYLILLTLVFPVISFGAEMKVLASPTASSGGEYIATIVLDSTNSINAVEGKIIFPPYLLSLDSIIDGNSAINFWISKPSLESQGVIYFSGITPGGFSGKSNTILSIKFKVKNSGVGQLALSNTRALLNDGKGTAEPLKNTNVDFKVSGSEINNISVPVRDTELPESFRPELSRNPFLFDSKWFVAFATQDKNSGILEYQIKESSQYLLSFRDKYEVATSPYLLKDQELRSFIFIKAIDNYGNERVETISPRYPLPWWENLSYWTIIILILLFFVVAKKWEKRRIKY